MGRTVRRAVEGAPDLLELADGLAVLEDRPAVEDASAHELRRTALAHARRLALHYDQMVPLTTLREGFMFAGDRVAFADFQSGIFKPRQLRSPAALSLFTAPPDPRKAPPYEDAYDEDAGVFTYRFRDPRSATATAVAAAERDNATLIAAHRLAVPLIYFKGVAPSQYFPIAPVLVRSIDVAKRVVSLEVGLPHADTQREGPTSDDPTRRYATRETAYRLHQHAFRRVVLAAYRTRCAVCSLREAPLLQAAHIVGDREDRGEATVVNGLALCAIHHLAYDRNLMGIDPDKVVHIHRRLLEEEDGPMLANGLQHFHGARILEPRRSEQRPDRERLASRFEAFKRASDG